MNRHQYLFELDRRLDAISLVEKEAAIKYYSEYFDEAGVENEQAVIKELGDPARVAAGIIAEATVNLMTQNDYGNKKQSSHKSFRGIWYIIGGICAAPIALPLAIAAVIAIFSLLIAAIAVALSLLATLVALVFAAVISFIAGVATLFTAPATGVLVIGFSLASAGVCLLLFIPISKLVRLMASGVAKLASKLFNRIKGGKR